MTGKEMLIKQLVSIFGLDAMLAEKLTSAAEAIASFDARLQRIERKLDVSLGISPQTLTMEPPHGIEPAPTGQQVNGAG